MKRLKNKLLKNIITAGLLTIATGLCSSNVLAEVVSERERSNDFSFSDEELKERNARLVAEEQKLLEQLQNGERQKDIQSQEAKGPVQDVDTSTRDAELVARLKEAESKLATKSRELNMAISQSESAKSQLGNLSALRSSHAETQRRLQAAEIRANELATELETTRSRLMISEVEVERLSSILEDRNRQSLSRLTGSSSSLAGQNTQARASISERRIDAPSERAPSSEMPIATVNVDNANLRTGPGLNNSPLMTVSKGTRLTVETRQGDWYRVISPTGARAWVASSVIAFGPGPQESPTRTVQIKGYNSSVEDQAFQLINRRAN